MNYGKDKGYNLVNASYVPRLLVSVQLLNRLCRKLKVGCLSMQRARTLLFETQRLFITFTVLNKQSATQLLNSYVPDKAGDLLAIENTKVNVMHSKPHTAAMLVAQ